MLDSPSQMNGLSSVRSDRLNPYPNFKSSGYSPVSPAVFPQTGPVYGERLEVLEKKIQRIKRDNDMMDVIQGTDKTTALLNGYCRAKALNHRINCGTLKSCYLNASTRNSYLPAGSVSTSSRLGADGFSAAKEYVDEVLNNRTAREMVFEPSRSRLDLGGKLGSLDSRCKSSRSKRSQTSRSGIKKKTKAKSKANSKSTLSRASGRSTSRPRSQMKGSVGISDLLEKQKIRKSMTGRRTKKSQKVPLRSRRLKLPK